MKERFNLRNRESRENPTKNVLEIFPEAKFLHDTAVAAGKEQLNQWDKNREQASQASLRKSAATHLLIEHFPINEDGVPMEVVSASDNRKALNVWVNDISSKSMNEATTLLNRRKLARIRFEIAVATAFESVAFDKHARGETEPVVSVSMIEMAKIKKELAEQAGLSNKRQPNN